ncbi:histidine kinase dimerization/phospho-acceptor domain-containing protein [uncultured Mediterranea sp.]|uniref:sensor histidine kinase n=1 Tax=uncultured Mediterranea sp. TaxID=1926662 RepID=UPI0027D9339E|nr:histidine kinase dimerization/phospho-acceptor domain-containing protein [uncultured Mediterranea sp.]
MKLLHYTYRKLSLWLLALMAVWGVLFYYTILYELMDETDDTLENYAQIIINNALYDESVLETEGNLMSFYYFHPLSVEEGENYRDMFYDSLVYVESEDEHEPVRVYRTAFRMPDGQFYELELMISTLERDDMANAMFWYLAVLFVLFLCCTAIGTRLILQKIFRPMNQLMDWLQHLHPGAEVPPLENATNIREFRLLGEVACDMANRSHKAYEEQKQFIENASHELQTPLAIARGKLELLAESEGMTEEQLKELDAIYATLGRAVKLNKALLLLSRIENGQYAETEDVCVDELLDELLPDLMEVYEHKQINLERVKGEQPFVIRCNASLAHILVTNLVKNALVHSPEGGRLVVETSSASLVVKNSGTAPLDASQLFKRFAHSVDRKKDSTGLGLAISEAIASGCSLRLMYRWEEGMHVFSLVK